MKKILSKILSVTMVLVTLSFCLPTDFAFAEDTQTKLIALTFDDGPNTTTTNDVLDVLEEYDAKASFFLIGTNITEESAVSVRRAYDMGMEIDNHSKSHGNMSKMTAEELDEEISYVDDKVYEITGEHTKFFRPPFIDVSQDMYDNIDLPFICGIDCQDYMENVTAEERANYILNGAKDGVIVLLHDAAGNQQTVDALKIAMPKLKEQGYEFVTLTELFKRQGETPKKNILYSNVAKYPCDDYTLSENIDSTATSTISLDKTTLANLGENYAIEVNYVSDTGYAPVIALQRWSTTPSIWHTIQPFYFNGERAVFLAEDIQAALTEVEADYADLDGISITAYSGTITLSDAKILVKATESDGTEALLGDVNANGTTNIADVVLLQKWLILETDASLGSWSNGDMNADERLDVLDLSILKQKLEGI